MVTFSIFTTFTEQIAIPQQQYLCGTISEFIAKHQRKINQNQLLNWRRYRVNDDLRTSFFKSVDKYRQSTVCQILIMFKQKEYFDN